MNKEQSVPNPHDAFFRRAFARPQVAAEFLRVHLPPALAAQLDLATVRREDTAFVDPELREHYADLLFRVRLNSGGEAVIFILLEHKSAPDERVQLQVLRYLVQKWDESPLPLPLIVPVVVYHGKRRWRVGRRFRDLFEPLALAPEWRIFLPDFEYYLVDVSRLTDDELQGALGVAPILQLLKYIFRRELDDKLPGVFGRTALDLPEDEAQELIRLMVVYLAESRRISQKQIGAALRRAIDEGAPMETILDKWESEWRQKGREEGMLIASANLTLGQLHLLLGKLDRGTEERVRALPVPKLTLLSQSLLKFQSQDDLKKWLHKQSPAPAATPTARKRPRG